MPTHDATLQAPPPLQTLAILTTAKHKQPSSRTQQQQPKQKQASSPWWQGDLSQGKRQAWPEQQHKGGSWDGGLNLAFTGRGLEVLPEVVALAAGQAAAAGAATAHWRVGAEGAGAAGATAGRQPAGAGLALDERASFRGALDGDDVHGRLCAKLLELVLDHRVPLHAPRRALGCQDLFTHERVLPGDDSSGIVEKKNDGRAAEATPRCDSCPGQHLQRALLLCRM